MGNIVTNPRKIIAEKTNEKKDKLINSFYSSTEVPTITLNGTGSPSDTKTTQQMNDDLVAENGIFILFLL